MRKIMMDCQTANLDEFRALAALAKETGATHVTVSQIEPSLWQWDFDRTDPYPNWGFYNATLFKIVVPDKLKAFLPVDYAQRNLDMIAARAAILKEFGLKAAFVGMDPAYLPEEVYMAHPAWRGPRCDQTRRARNEYYAPCIDNPEVQELFREGFRRLCEVAPIEYFAFLTNDSGGGLCWSEGLYPGKNGPKACAHISAGERICKFLDIVQEGAALAGVKAEAGYRGNFRESEVASALPKLKEGQFVKQYLLDGRIGTVNVGLGSGYGNPTFPIKAMPLPVTFAAMLQNGRANKDCNLLIQLSSVADSETNRLLVRSFSTIGQGPLARYEALHAVAAELVGEQYAQRLASAWEQVDKAVDKVSYLYNGGHIFMLGTVHERWLTRPFVAFPGELTPEEYEYFRPFQFQAQTEKEANDMLNLQASKWISGHSGMQLILKTMTKARENLAEALSIVNGLIKDLGAHPYVTELKAFALKLRLYRCIMDNAENVCRFQIIIDRTDYNETPVDTTDIWYEMGDVRYVNIRRIVRDEIDNCLEIIGILEEADRPLLQMTDSEEHETVRYLGPDLISDLRKKITIMENHHADFSRLYKSNNL